jgi:hypothetical protein
MSFIFLTRIYLLFNDSLLAIIIVNVLNYFSSLRTQLSKGVDIGFIHPDNLALVTFVDGPDNEAEHADYDWGTAVIGALNNWKPGGWEGYGLDWTKKQDGSLTSPLNAV